MSLLQMSVGILVSYPFKDESSFLDQVRSTRCNRYGSDYLRIEKGERTADFVRASSLVLRLPLASHADCLKWADRQQMLISELTSYAAETDIICLQVRQLLIPTRRAI